MQKASRPTRRLLAVLLAAGLIILLDQAADLTATVLSRPVDFSAANWRFGLFGLIAGRTSALLAGDVMLFTATVLLGLRKTLRTLGALHVALALAILAGLVLFVLDVIQVRGAVPPASTDAFSAAVFRAGVIALAGGITAAWAGIAAWRTAGSWSGRRSGTEHMLVTDSGKGAES